MEDEVERQKEEQERQHKAELFRDYVGLYLHDVDVAVRVIVGADRDVPSYLEAAHPKEIKKDKRTAAEIKQHVLDLLAKAG